MLIFIDWPLTPKVIKNHKRSLVLSTLFLCSLTYVMFNWLGFRAILKECLFLDKNFYQIFSCLNVKQIEEWFKYQPLFLVFYGVQLFSWKRLSSILFYLTQRNIRELVFGNIILYWVNLLYLKLDLWSPCMVSLLLSLDWSFM